MGLLAFSQQLFTKFKDDQHSYESSVLKLRRYLRAAQTQSRALSWDRRELNSIRLFSLCCRKIWFQRLTVFQQRWGRQRTCFIIKKKKKLAFDWLSRQHALLCFRTILPGSGPKESLAAIEPTRGHRKRTCRPIIPSIQMAFLQL